MTVQITNVSPTNNGTATISGGSITVTIGVDEAVTTLSAVVAPTPGLGQPINPAQGPTPPCSAGNYTFTFNVTQGMYNLTTMASNTNGAAETDITFTAQ